MDKDNFNINTTETKLLYAILEELREIKCMVALNIPAKEIGRTDTSKVELSLDNMTHEELIETAKLLPGKPKGWNFKTDQWLKEFILVSNDK